jgi:hypothetical protein
MTRPILTAESVTELGAEVRGAVLVAGSHGGVIAAHLGAMAGAHALILNDAGIGLEGAGIAGLDWLDAIGMAAAAVSHMSARIGDGADSLARGRISHANHVAQLAGVVPGMSARDAAVRLSGAAAAHAAPPAYADGRWRIGAQGQHEVWALDSVGKLVPADAGRILLIGSHGGLHGGRADSALDCAGRPVGARAVAFNDAGVGIDQVGTTRLPELERRGVPAVTDSHVTARIGDGRSMIDARISFANGLAAASGACPGMCLREWIARL